MNAHTVAGTMLAALLTVLTLASSTWAECTWVMLCPSRSGEAGPKGSGR